MSPRLARPASVLGLGGGGTRARAGEVAGSQGRAPVAERGSADLQGVGAKEATAPRAPTPATAGRSSRLARRSGRPVARQPRPASQPFRREPSPPRPIKTGVGAFYLLRTPPRRDALRHSGGESRLWTSPTVTLYLEVELSRDKRPGTEQNTSPVLTDMPPRKPSLFIIREVTDLGGTGTREREKKKYAIKVTGFRSWWPGTECVRACAGPRPQDAREVESWRRKCLWRCGACRALCTSKCKGRQSSGNLPRVRRQMSVAGHGPLRYIHKDATQGLDCAREPGKSYAIAYWLGGLRHFTEPFWILPGFSICLLEVIVTMHHIKR